MHNITTMKGTDLSERNEDHTSLVQAAEGLLAEVGTGTENRSSYIMSMPIAELSALGAGVSSLIPPLDTVTENITINTEGLYRVANMSSGDKLKLAKDGSYWGALKTADGSKMAKLTKVEPMNMATTTQVASAINPATMMMAVTLFSIEQKLGDMEEMQKQILQHMEIDKESQVEGDVEQLISIINKYKHNWDNDQFVSNNHKMVSDIQRTARKHMNSYQKKVNAMIDSKQKLVAQNKVKSAQKSLVKEFQYYRLSLFTFSMASLLEIMLSGNYKEEYIAAVKEEIEAMAQTYREVFEKCSIYLEKKSHLSVEANILKGVGNVSRLTGKVIGAIPIVEKGQADEFLQDRGSSIINSARDIEQNAVREFSAISNPGTAVFTEKMKDLIEIHNHTVAICVDKKHIYLVKGA